MQQETDDYRSLLEAIVRKQKRMTWQEAADAAAKAFESKEQESMSLSGRHFARLARLEGDITPTPAVSRALQYAFGRPVSELLSPYSPGALTTTSDPSLLGAGTPKEALSVAANRAQKFAINMPAMGDASLDQIVDGVRDLALAYPARPLPEVLGHLVQTQDDLFALLERPQKPAHGRQLYFLAGVVGGMLAKASHDLADPSAALTQSRTAYLCAEQADHPGLRGWISGLQSLVSYWAGRPNESIKYAQRGATFATNSTAVWLPAGEARAWARMGNAEKARDALRRAEDAWNNVQPDELDELGGITVFSRSRQLYYAADALAWLPADGNNDAATYAAQAVDAYADPDHEDWAFGDQAGSQCDLAIARINAGEVDGAAEAIAPVLGLPSDQRMSGIVKSVNHVHRALNSAPASGVVTELQEQIESFTRVPLRALQQGR